MGVLPVTEVAPARAAIYLQKAQQFQRSAEKMIGTGEEEAAGLLAIHAAISACDSLTVKHPGLRSTSPHHLDVLRLIERLPLGGKEEIKKQLRALLSRKNVVEYGDRLLPRGDAGEMVKIAGRLVAAASR